MTVWLVTHVKRYYVTILCLLDTCASVNCNQGSCEALLETQTQCNCFADWYGKLCDISEYLPQKSPKGWYSCPDFNNLCL